MGVGLPAVRAGDPLTAIRPALLASARVQRCHICIRDRPFASAQEYWQLLDPWISPGPRAVARPGGGIGARRLKPELAASVHRGERGLAIRLLVGLQNTQLVARPAGAGAAMDRVQLRQIPAGVDAILLAGLLPERNPLASVLIAHTLRSAHDAERDRPNRHVRQVPAAASQRTPD